MVSLERGKNANFDRKLSAIYVALRLNTGIALANKGYTGLYPTLALKSNVIDGVRNMSMMTWELWLAREVIVDCPLPWQKPQIKLTPGRVAQGFGAVIALIGTPTSAPQPRGKSPGWKKGQLRNKRKRYPIVKKGKGKFESHKKGTKKVKSA